MATSEQYESIIASLQWDGLRALWDNIEKRNTPGWEQGKAFEYLVIRAICKLLTLKYRVCVENGFPDYDIRERDIP